MPPDPAAGEGFERVQPETLSHGDRYCLLTSVVVPRPIGWVSTRGESGVENLAPFSYFGAVSVTPMLISVSIAGRRDGTPKDSLVNLRATGRFCVNVVTLDLFERMNQTSADLPPDRSEFEFGDVPLAWTSGGTPYVATCPVVLDCSVFQEVALPAPSTSLVLGQVEAVRLRDGLRPDGTWSVDPALLQPVGRLGANWYSLPGELAALGRPRSD